MQHQHGQNLMDVSEECVEVGLVQTGTSRRTVLRDTVIVHTSDVK